MPQSYVEKRGSQRTILEDLPENLHQFNLLFSSGEEIIADTIDASENGIGLRVPLPANRIIDFMVSISPLDHSFNIHDELVYIKAIDQNTSRISIKFSKQANLTKYLNLLNENRHN